MTRTAPRFRKTVAALSLAAPSVPVPPPSEAVVAAVLAFADVAEERDDGLVVLRLSAERLTRTDMALLLDADDRTRAQDISVLWDAEEDEIVRVIDLAPLRAGREAFGREIVGREGVRANAYAAARMREGGFARAA